MTECPGIRCDGRAVHDPPHRPGEEYYDYVDPDTGHAIRVDKLQDEHGGIIEIERCMTRLYRPPDEEPKEVTPSEP